MHVAEQRIFFEANFVIELPEDQSSHKNCNL